MLPSIAAIIRRIQADKQTLGITLYAPASEADIAAFEQTMGLLPDELKTFYRFCNGFESEEDMFRIIPLDEIMDTKPDSYLKQGDFYIAEYMVYCDAWPINISNDDSNSYSIYRASNLVLTSSFAEFMERFLNGGVFEAGGLYDWDEEVDPVKTKAFNENLVQRNENIAQNKPLNFFQRLWRRLF